MKQIEFYEAKLKFETDSWDLNQMIINNDEVVRDLLLWYRM